jgi:hypothetical protein
MDFMKRGQKRRADEMREAKEEWERDMEEMMRQRDADSDDENLEAEAKAPEETEVKGRRTVQKDLGTTQAGSSGSSAPVKFSGATHQTEKAALSSGRTVRMSGHATIGTTHDTTRTSRTSSLTPSSPPATSCVSRRARSSQEGHQADHEGARDRQHFCRGGVPRRRGCGTRRA